MTRTLVGADDPDDPYQARIREATQIATTGHVPKQPERLTRRKRHLVVAADRWQGHATVWFIRRGHNGQPVNETIHLELTNGVWAHRGGGGSEPGADLSTRIGLAELANHFSRQHHHSKAEQIPFGFHTGSSAGPKRASFTFQAVTEAATLTFNDREVRPIAEHGFCLVAYNPSRPPTITALDARGVDLGSFTLKRNPHRQRLWMRHLGHRLTRPSHQAVLNRRRRWGRS